MREGKHSRTPAEWNKHQKRNASRDSWATDRVRGVSFQQSTRSDASVRNSDSGKRMERFFECIGKLDSMSATIRCPEDEY